MANEIAKRDQNDVPVIMGITDDSAQELRMLRVDPVTGRVLVSGTGGGTIGGSIAATQVAFGSGANTITGENNFTYTNNGTLTLGAPSGGTGHITLTEPVGGAHVDFGIVPDDGFAYINLGSTGLNSMTISDNGSIALPESTLHLSGSFRATQSITIGTTNVSNQFSLFILSNSGAADKGIVLYDGGNNDKDVAMYLDGSSYFHIGGSGFSSPVDAVIIDNTLGIGLSVPDFAYKLDVLGAVHVAGNNLEFMKVDPDNLYAYVGDITGTFGNHSYVEVNDNASQVNIRGGAINMLNGTVFIGDNQLYQTQGMQIGGASNMSIAAEAAYSFKTGSLPSGSLTEGSGRLLSYAINVGQIGTRDESIVGGIFRMDTRTGVGSGGTYDGNQSYIVYGSPTGGSAFNNRFAANFQTGETLLCADGGNVGIGAIHTPSARLHLPAGSATASTAPLKYTSGALLTAAEVGTSEFLTDLYYKTITTGTVRGVSPVYLTGRFTAQTAAKTTVLSYTPTADSSFLVSANVLVTTSTLCNFTTTVTYTDEGNTSRTLTLTFSNLGGTLLTAIVNTGGAVPYEGVPLTIRAKANTSIVIGTVGTFTTVTYNVEGFITRIA